MTDDLLTRIRIRRDGLPPAERTIADLVLRDPGAAAECTITALAKAADTSETTVHRFCRSLDLRGYAQLRLGLAAEAERLRADSRADLAIGGEIGPDDTLEQLVGKVGYADARAAEETAGQLDLTALAALADAVGSARRTELFGLGSSALAAQDAAQKLLRLGYWATVGTDVHAALTSAALLRPGDLALTVTHSGRAREVVDFLRQARESGAVTAAVTSNPASPAAGLADIVLVTAARETTFRSGGTASRIAQLTVVDCLYLALAQRSYQQTVEDLERAHEAVRSRSLRPR
ncbi:MurR/RpiR family transcriptional regulator [Kitasatospora sp. NPDC002040]|uniref:MurR/RpiR family transcriptional regulator n=1 Tax=Kitasatospora sp. NPDC002040 TaxID=3154661 RepID=UPI00331D705F